MRQEVVKVYLSLDPHQASELADMKISLCRARDAKDGVEARYFVVRKKHTNFSVKHRFGFWRWKWFWNLSSLQFHIRVVMRELPTCPCDDGGG